jgi:hypothetical protein
METLKMADDSGDTRVEFLDEVLEEEGMTFDEFRERFPHAITTTTRTPTMKAPSGVTRASSSFSHLGGRCGSWLTWRKGRR